MAETRIDQLTGLRVLLEPDAEGLAGCALCDPPAAGLEPTWSDPVAGLSSFSRGGPAAEQAPPPAADGGLSSIADPLRASTRGTDVGLFGSQPVSDAVELIASGEDHGATLAELAGERIEALCRAWQARIQARAASSSYVSVSLDEGPGLHGQTTIRALDFVPAELARERERSAAYHERTMGGHLLGDVVTAEIRRRERFIAVDDETVLLCPWASRSAFELRIVPREPAPRYEEGPSAASMIATAARLLRDVLGTAAGLAVWVRTAPRGAEEFCWHIDLIPRPGERDGFGLGTGVDVDRVAPEQAAARLREAYAERRRGGG